MASPRAYICKKIYDSSNNMCNHLYIRSHIINEFLTGATSGCCR